jgi:hypothetical protein
MQTIGAADRKSDFGRTSIAPYGNPVGEHAARPLAAALVEDDERDAGRQCAKDQVALSAFEQPGRKRTFFLHFHDYGRRQDPGGVKRLKVLERTAA